MRRNKISIDAMGKHITIDNPEMVKISYKDKSYEIKINNNGIRNLDKLFRRIADAERRVMK